MDKGGIYRIRNSQNEKIYVGSAAELRKRWRTHKSRLERGVHHSPKLQAAWKKYGAEAFVFEVIEYVEPAQLRRREQYYLDTLQPFYNISPTAGRVTFTDEARARISNSLKAQGIKPPSRKGVKAGSYSEEHRGKISAALTGIKRTPEQVEAMRQRATNISDETRERMRQSALNRRKREREAA